MGLPRGWYRRIRGREKKSAGVQVCDMSRCVCQDDSMCTCECVRTSESVYVCQANAVSQRNSGAQL